MSEDSGETIQPVGYEPIDPWILDILAKAWVAFDKPELEGARELFQTYAVSSPMAYGYIEGWLVPTVEGMEYAYAAYAALVESLGLDPKDEKNWEYKTFDDMYMAAKLATQER